MTQAGGRGKEGHARDKSRAKDDDFWEVLMIGASIRDVRELGRRVLDAVIPPRCIKCGDVVADTGALCAGCFEQITFITEPFCQSCGIPFSDSYAAHEDGLICGACTAHAPAFDRARAVLVYDDNSRSLVTSLKYADRTDLAPALARWMARAGTSLIDDADIILPVPLHRWRLLMRKYNQSSYLARSISRLTGLPVEYGLLRRVKATQSQGRLSAAARRRNVAAAFSVSRPDQVVGKRVIIVDDVLTTGATLNACAATLRKAGAQAVDALVVGRVPVSDG